MHALILAGGEGSRLKQDGVVTPKATVELQGRPQLLRLVDQLLLLGAETVTCMLRSGIDLPPIVVRHVRPFELTIQRCETPSPVHTLAAGLRIIPSGPVFCTMVDTVMPSDSWARVYAASESKLAAGALAVIAVTPYVDDERALYVESAGDRIAGLVDEPREPVRVTGGVYALSAGARDLGLAAPERGIDRMRGYLRLLLDAGRVESVEVAQIVDLDRAQDLDAARTLLARHDPDLLTRRS